MDYIKVFLAYNFLGEGGYFDFFAFLPFYGTVVYCKVKPEPARFWLESGLETRD